MPMDMPGEVMEGCAVSRRGFDMREKMVWRETAPTRARP